MRGPKRPVLVTTGDATPSAEDEARSRARHHETVAAIAGVALAVDDLQEVMDEAVRLLVETFRLDYAAILEATTDAQSLLLRAGAGWREGLVGTARVDSDFSSQAGFTLLANEPVIVADLRSDRRFSWPALLRDHDVVSGMSVVIPGHHKPYGVLSVHTKRRRDFTSDEVHFIRSVANTLAAAVRGWEATQALRDSEARIRAVVTTAVDAIITIDERGIVDSMNPAGERMFGYAAGEVVGRNVSILMPEPYSREHDRYLSNYVRTGRAKIIGIGREVVGRRKDGTTFPMDLAVSEFRLGEGRMFTGIVRDVTERRRMEQEILDISAAEQRRIGQDLHDGLCQQLAGVAFATEVLSRKLSARAAPEAASVGQIAVMVDHAITQARDLARGLQPVTLESDGLTSALKQLAGKVTDMFRVSCLFWCDHAVLVHDNAVATHLFRVAQEAVSNAIRHGKAKRIVVDLAIAGGELCLTVTDDGVGIAQTAGDGKGMGIQTMSYRAKMIGGTLTVRPGTKGGTVVTCVLPDRGGVERVDGKAIDAGEEKRRGRGGQGTSHITASPSRGAAGATGAAEDKDPVGRRSPDRPRAAGGAGRPGAGPGGLRGGRRRQGGAQGG